MSTNVYKRFDPRVMEREERIRINHGLPMMILIKTVKYYTYIKFKIRLQLLLTTMSTQLYVRPSISHTCGKHLHGHIVSQTGKVWADKTSVIQQHFTEVSIPSHKRDTFRTRLVNLLQYTCVVLPDGANCILQSIVYFVGMLMSFCTIPENGM